MRREVGSLVPFLRRPYFPFVLTHSSCLQHPASIRSRRSLAHQRTALPIMIGLPFHTPSPTFKPSFSAQASTTRRAWRYGRLFPRPLACTMARVTGLTSMVRTCWCSRGLSDWHLPAGEKGSTDFPPYAPHGEERS
jgi:hypothetical protein